MDKLKQLFQRWNNRRILRKAKQRIINSKDIGICDALRYIKEDSYNQIRTKFKMDREYAIKYFNAREYGSYWWFTSNRDEDIKNRIAYIDYLIKIQ